MLIKRKQSWEYLLNYLLDIFTQWIPLCLCTHLPSSFIVDVAEIKSYLISFAFASNVAWQKWHHIACFCSSCGRIKIFVDIYWTASRCLGSGIKDSNASLKYNCPCDTYDFNDLLSLILCTKTRNVYIALSSGQESWLTEFFGFGRNNHTIWRLKVYSKAK